MPRAGGGARAAAACPEPAVACALWCMHGGGSDRHAACASRCRGGWCPRRWLPPHPPRALCPSGWEQTNINDGGKERGDTPIRRAHERLIRKLLNLPSRPAVVELVYYRAFPDMHLKCVRPGEAVMCVEAGGPVHGTALPAAVVCPCARVPLLLTMPRASPRLQLQIRGR